MNKRKYLNDAPGWVFPLAANLIACSYAITSTNVHVIPERIAVAMITERHFEFESTMSSSVGSHAQGSPPLTGVRTVLVVVIFTCDVNTMYKRESMPCSGNLQNLQPLPDRVSRKQRGTAHDTCQATLEWTVHSSLDVLYLVLQGKCLAFAASVHS